MATDPTINGKTLTAGGSHTNWPQPDPNVVLSYVPGVVGSYSQSGTLDSAFIIGEGIQKSTSHAALKALIRSIQLTAGTKASQYVDNDASTHENCTLLSYDRSGPIQREADNSVWCAVVFRVLKAVPS